MHPLQLLMKLADENVCLGLCNASNTGLADTTPDTSRGHVALIMGIVFAVIGAVALIFVLIGGISFVTSQGNPDKASQARMTIIYAIIGLVIAMSAEAIVYFVIGKV
jgi:hypothetical protein